MYLKVMYLKLNCLLVHLVLHNALATNQIYLNNQFLRNKIFNRNEFKYGDFNDKFKLLRGQLRYKRDMNDTNDEPPRKQKDNPLNSPDTSSLIISEANTSPMIFVTLPSSSPVTAIAITTAAETSTDPGVTINASVTESTYPVNNALTLPAVETSSAVEVISLSVTQTATVVTPLTSPLTISSVSAVQALTSPDVATSTVPTNVSLTIPVAESTSNMNLNQTTTSSVSTDQSANSSASAIELQIISKPVENSLNETTTTELITTSSYSESTTQAVARNWSNVIVQKSFQDVRTTGAGYFSFFCLAAARIITKKKDKDATKLLQACEIEIIGLITANKLSFFGKSTRAGFLRLIQTMNNLNPQIVKYQTSLADSVILNKRQVLGREIANLVEEADNMFIDDEGRRIYSVLEEMENYPDVDRSAQQIAHDAVDAVLIAPFTRVYGSAIGNYIVQNLDQIVINMAFSGYSVQRRKAVEDLTHTMSRNTKSPRFGIPLTSITYKINNLLIKRKPSTRTQLRRKTTRKPIRVSRNQKSIYIIKKNDKTKKYKVNAYKKINNTEEYKVTYLKLANLHRPTVILNNKVKFKTKFTRKKLKVTIRTINDSMKKSTKDHKHKNLQNDHKINKDAESKQYNLIKRKNSRKKYVEIQQFIPKTIKDDSSFTDEEEKLKANLDDAFFHGNNEPVLRNREEVEKSSYSDEEAVLKSNIYKVFGDQNEFAKLSKIMKQKI